jgi:hypothetical protein
MRTEPVAETKGIRRSATSDSPTSASDPIASPSTPSHPFFARTSAQILCVAIAVSEALSEGFQITVSPHTSASIAFHAQTALGKLNAVTTATGPSGCHCSYMRCRARSECMLRP